MYLFAVCVQKWRRRFFQLYKLEAVSASDTLEQYRFSYYDDESLNKKRGSVKLSECVKIQSSLDSACYQHLFAVQTYSKRVSEFLIILLILVSVCSLVAWSAEWSAAVLGPSPNVQVL